MALHLTFVASFLVLSLGRPSSPLDWRSSGRLFLIVGGDGTELGSGTLALDSRGDVVLGVTVIGCRDCSFSFGFQFLLDFVCLLQLLGRCWLRDGQSAVSDWLWRSELPLRLRRCHRARR